MKAVRVQFTPECKRISGSKAYGKNAWKDGDEIVVRIGTDDQTG